MSKEEINEAIKKAKKDKDVESAKNDNKKEGEQTKPSEKTVESKEKELLISLQMLQADFENYRKRVDRDKEDFCSFASKGILEKLIPFIDNFELALKNKDHENKEEFVKAIEMVQKQLWSILHKEGIKKIDAKGKNFNPELHEPLLQEESDKKPNTVLEELQPGYVLKNRVLRHAKVKIAKAKQDKNKSMEE